MQGDRVIALLKALGYATVEFIAEQGESVEETVYTVLQEVYGYPLIIKFIDANKTSLMAPSIDGGGGEASGLGGTYLHQQTSGAPEQRLFIVYEKAYPEQMHALMQLLRNDIDVPALEATIPIGRMAQPAEIAAFAAWLVKAKEEFASLRAPVTTVAEALPAGGL